MWSPSVALTLIRAGVYNPPMSEPTPTSTSFRRVQDRAADSLRPVTLELGVQKFAEGSALIKAGDTHVLAAASIEKRVPPFVQEGHGWLTAEYAMLPRATQTRSTREVSRGKQSGRSQEIQRLIGRSLRQAVDLSKLPDITLTLDCDVLQADGGTRTASITAAYAATVQALGQVFLAGDLPTWPLRRQIAAVSVGLMGELPLLDLDYVEDRDGAVDMNVVGTPEGELVEVQGTGESRGFARSELDALLDLAQKGIGELAHIQNQALGGILEDVDAVRQRAGRQSGQRRPAPARSEKDLWGPPG